MSDLDKSRAFSGAARRVPVPKIAILFAALVLVAAGLMLASAERRAQAAPPWQSDPPQPPDSGSPAPDAPTGTSIPRSCSECHVEVAAAWAESLHAQAFVDPVFQERWQEVGNDPACLACHTTGYDPSTGSYTHPGVTCEVCHGLTPPGHPGQPVRISPGPGTCEDCHPTTAAEWRDSPHGAQYIPCATCHNLHPLQLRFNNDSVALCLSCHKQPRNDYVHLTHQEQLCMDCHWLRPTQEDLLAHFVSGALFPTGHTARVETAACVRCHAERAAEAGTLAALNETIDELGLADSPHPLLAAQERIHELETEVRSARAKTRLAIWGAMAGVVAGSLLTLLIVRMRRRRTRQQ